MFPSPAGAIPTLTDVGPWRLNYSGITNLQHSTSGKLLSFAISADGTRLYAGCYAGIWRSDDAGDHWQQMVRPQPGPGETVSSPLWAPDVWDIAVSPLSRDIVLVYATGDTRVQARNGIYLSNDGGGTWTFKEPTALITFGNGASAYVPGEIAFAPDNGNLVFAAVGTEILKSTNGGVSWAHTTVPNGGFAWHVAVGPQQGAVRNVFAAGDSRIYYSADAGANWAEDDRTPACASTFPTASFGGFDNLGQHAHILAVDPDNPSLLYVAAQYGANGPSYFHPSTCPADFNCPQSCPAWANAPLPQGGSSVGRCAGEGSLWLGDFTSFATQSAACWQALPGPPTYYGDATVSGASFVYTQDLPGPSHLVFFSDAAHVHVAQGLPARGSWFRLTGSNLSDDQAASHLWMHVDPHGIAFTPDLSFRLHRPIGIPAPYDSNAVADSLLGGTIWMANDGGVAKTVSFDAQNHRFNWSTSNGGDAQLPAALHTLELNNLVGAESGPFSPALYFGTGDNDDFVSLSGGAFWDDLRPNGACGDCSVWFNDAADVSRVVTVPRSGVFELHQSPPSGPYTDTRGTGPPQYLFIDCPPDGTGGCGSLVSLASADDLDRNYEPLVRTLPGEAAPPQADLLVIRNKAVGRAVFRILRPDLLQADRTRWDNTPSVVVQLGPDLPANTDIRSLQSSGGHGAGLVLYVGDGANQVWRWPSDAGPSVWKPIVGPSIPQAPLARRFFVDPYDANEIYIIGANAMQRSDDGGAVWQTDVSLDNAVTEGGIFRRDPLLLFDRGRPRPVVLEMLFDRNEPGTRFAIGNAGVFVTRNGRDWCPFFNATAMPSHPTGMFFNRDSSALYVGFRGRGTLKMSPVSPQCVTPGFCWLADGSPVSKAVGAQSAARMAPDGSGGAFVVWQDARSGTHVYAQHLLADGSVASGWDPDGQPISVATGTQSAPAIASDGAGGAYIVWQQSGVADLDIFGQRVRSNGTVYWSPNGIPICSVGGDQDTPAMVADGSGNAIVTWRDHRALDVDVYAVAVDGAGATRPGWSPGGNAMCTAPGDQAFLGPRIAADGAGGAYIAWQDARNGTSNWDVYAQHASATGAAAWNVSVGLPVSTAVQNQLEVAIAAVSGGAAVVTWADSRTAATASDIYAQRLTTSGVSWTPDGVPVCTASGVQSSSVVCSDGGPGAIVAWSDQRSGTNEIYAQHLSSLGGPTWIGQGAKVSASAGAPQIVPDRDGGAIVTWASNRLTGSLIDVYAQRMTSTGVVATGWPNDGMTVSAATNNQRFPTLLDVGPSRALVVWQDRRGGVDDDLYAECVSDQLSSSAVTAVTEVPITSRLRIQVPYPNPSIGAVTLEIVEEASMGPPTVEIFDVAGRLVRGLTAGAHAAGGAYTIRWNRTDASGALVSSGIYLVRARSGADIARSKIVIVR